ncbi:hypothetical protein Drorol1_Dr00020102, partial [Drosera rotundifolia]
VHFLAFPLRFTAITGKLSAGNTPRRHFPVQELTRNSLLHLWFFTNIEILLQLLSFLVLSSSFTIDVRYSSNCQIIIKNSTECRGRVGRKELVLGIANPLESGVHVVSVSVRSRTRCR